MSAETLVQMHTTKECMQYLVWGHTLRRRSPGLEGHARVYLDQDGKLANHNTKQGACLTSFYEPEEWDAEL